MRKAAAVSHALILLLDGSRVYSFSSPSFDKLGGHLFFDQP
mgnify:CR=1 FL=1